MIKKRVLQIAHGINSPFYELSNIYASAVKSDEVEVDTVFLTGRNDKALCESHCSKNVTFLDFDAKQLRGMKIEAIKIIYRMLLNKKYDLIIAHRYKSIYISCMSSFFSCSDIPVVGVAHAYNVFKGLGRNILTFSFKRRLTLLGVSGSISENIKSTIPRSTHNKVYAMANAVDCRKMLDQLVDRAGAREKFGIGADDFIFSNVGRLHNKKNQILLLESFSLIHKKMPDAKLMIVGDGPNMNDYQSYCKDSGIADKVIFTGNIPSAYKYYRAFDCYVSVRLKEPFGIVLTEAMLAKVPLIAISGGGVDEVIADTGLLVFESSSGNLAKIMLEIYKKNASEKDLMINKAYDRVIDLYSIESFSRRFSEVPVVKHVLGLG